MKGLYSSSSHPKGKALIGVPEHSRVDMSAGIANLVFFTLFVVCSLLLDCLIVELWTLLVFQSCIAMRLVQVG
jgi:hypothetical protein